MLSTISALPLYTARSVLISQTPDAVPTVEELVALETELKLNRSRFEGLSKKAENEMKSVENTLRKMKEEGKIKELKLKNERTATPDVEESATPPLSLHRQTLTSKLKNDLKKPKKRKREGDSEDEKREPPHKARKFSPMPPSDAKKHPKVALPPAPKMTPSGYRIADDFTAPPIPTLPNRPTAQPIPKPGPMKPTDVTEDFSKTKPPAQTAITTFYTWIDPWLRPIREDDLGLLQWNGEMVEPFVVPTLGRHYSEVWEEEDRELYGHSLIPTTHATSSAPSTSARLSHNANWDPSKITDMELITDERGTGPLAERLVSAMLDVKADKPEPPTTGKDEEKTAKSVFKGPYMHAMDLEDRLKAELQAIGLFQEDEQPEYDPCDDQILTELRRTQRVLKAQMEINKARRGRLLAIAQDCVAYGEYIDNREALDRQITSIYSRLQKRDSTKNGAIKKRKKPGSAAMVEEKEKEKERLCPASLGLGPDANGKLEVSEQLINAVRLRRQWVDIVGGAMKKKQEEHPGRLWGLPPKSIYEGLEDALRGTSSLSNAMDIDS
ncbi:hypothetical protein SISSUDRAFT_1063859 [Sistotremastrum suecicum HHB10207 ss-3]|uniref:Transcriptional adapter 3 n=1 Tax=Sistotremastrum suecicum HHB10207 ss-3 TaxID=1314776 RepID=A0A166BBU2_9AGAM|nr:hypothetical protein SISSUDRAFT_1063859 [Sistotremastrum suecicum HHB10207 ss-3]